MGKRRATFREKQEGPAAAAAPAEASGGGGTDARKHKGNAQASNREALITFYKRVAPEHLQNVDEIIRRFDGDAKGMWALLDKMYPGQGALDAAVNDIPPPSRGDEPPPAIDDDDFEAALMAAASAQNERKEIIEDDIL